MFGKLGDMAGMLKQAKDMQKNMEKVQEELASLEVSGKSDCGRVEVVATCDLIIKRVSIANECLETSDSGIVEGLVLEATNSALNNAKMRAQEKMSEITGGLNLPGM